MSHIEIIEFVRLRLVVIFKIKSLGTNILKNMYLLHVCVFPTSSDDVFSGGVFEYNRFTWQ
jgi:hypothetical protein